MIFDEKEKEPLLSEEMKGIINRSIDEKNSSNLDDIFRYKYKIMQMLISNQDILHALHNDELSKGNEVINGDLYRDVCIFDFMKLPDNKTEVKNYVCFEVNDVSSYDSLVNKRIIFRTVSHEDDYKTDWGISRHDLLASIIKNEFDWSNALGMHFEKESDNGYVTNDGYYYREIIYKIVSPNNTYNKLNNVRLL